MRKLLVILYISVLSGVANAETYYIRADGAATQAVSAKSDQGNCSAKSNAMNIATHNAGTFAPDDTVYLCNDGGDYPLGKYSEKNNSLRPPNSGTKNHPITYSSAPSQTAVFTGYKLLDTAACKIHRNPVYAAANVWSCRSEARILWEDDVPLQSQIGYDWASVSTDPDVQWTYEVGGGKLLYKPTSGVPTDHVVKVIWYDSKNTVIDLRDRSHIRVSGIKITQAGYAIKDGFSDTTPAGSTLEGIQIDNMIFDRVWWAVKGDAIGDKSRLFNFKMLNNTCNFCNSGFSHWTKSYNNDGSLGDRPGPYVESIIHKGNVGNNFGYAYDNGDGTFRHWHVYGHTRTNALADAEFTSLQAPVNCVIDGNTVNSPPMNLPNNAQHWIRPISIYITRGHYGMHNNKFTNNKYIGEFDGGAIYMNNSPRGGISNNVIANNLIVDNSAQKLTLGIALNIQDADNVTNNSPGMNSIVNNTIMSGMDSGAGIRLSDKGGSIGSWQIKNNITRAGVKISLGAYIKDSPMITINNNLYIPRSDSNWSFAYYTRGSTFAYWQSVGYDLDGVEAPPLFTNEEAGDYTLQSGSPAIGIGAKTDICCLEDIREVVRDSDPDAGAYEYQAP